MKIIKTKIMNENKVDVPIPANPENLLDQFKNFVDIVKILREKCPWDSVQTNESIAYLLVEETYEMIDAIEKKDDDDFAKELGDVLLHVVMHAVMAEERGAFNMTDVLKKIQHKLVTRHPHVFGDVTVSGENDVMVNWEHIKMKEGQKSVLSGVPNNMPALLRAQRIQHKASRIGFDWDNKDAVWDKIEEELKELRVEFVNKNSDKAMSELGDVLFAITNAARFEDIMAEEALQRTNNKFTRRFKYIEEKAKEQGMKLQDMTLAEMDALWDEAKAGEQS